MIKKIKSINEIGGFLTKDEKYIGLIQPIVKDIIGYKGFKLYLDKSIYLLPILRIIIMANKDYEIMNALDSSLNDIEIKLKNEFRHRAEKIFIFIIWK